MGSRCICRSVYLAPEMGGVLAVIDWYDRRPAPRETLDRAHSARSRACVEVRGAITVALAAGDRPIERDGFVVAADARLDGDEIAAAWSRWRTSFAEHLRGDF